MDGLICFIGLLGDNLNISKAKLIEEMFSHNRSKFVCIFFVTKDLVLHKTSFTEDLYYKIPNPSKDLILQKT